MTDVIEYANNRVIYGTNSITFDAPKEFGWASFVTFYVGVLAYGFDGSPPESGTLEAVLEEADDYESAWSEIPGAAITPVSLQTPLPALRSIKLGPADFGNRVRLVLSSRFSGGGNPRWRFNLSAVCKV